MTLSYIIFIFAAQQRLTIAAVDAKATKGDEAWTEEEERELQLLVNDEEYRKVPSCCLINIAGKLCHLTEC